MKRVCWLLLAAVSLFVFTGCSRARTRGEVINGLEPVTLSFNFFGNKFAATDEVWNAIADEFRNELNVYFDINFIAGTDYIDKMLVMSAAGDVWDMNYDADWLQYSRVVAMNGYMALDDLLPRYAPDLYKAYQESGVLEAARVNGRIVALPGNNVQSHRPFFQWRSDLFDADPTAVSTIEDVERILYELRRLYPNRYIMHPNGTLEVFLMKYDLLAAPYGFVFNADDPAIQVQFIAETTAYRERARFAERWQRDGIFWADILVDQLDYNYLINQGLLISTFGTHEFTNFSRAFIEPDARWGFNSMYDDKKFPIRSALANVIAIPRTARNPERTLMFLNLMETSQKMFDMVMYGIEGKTYVMDPSRPNTVMYPPGMNDNNSNFMNWPSRWALFKPQFMRGDPMYEEGFWQKEKDFALSNPNNIIPPLDGFSLQTDAIAIELAQIIAILDTAERMLAVGLAGPSDAAIDRLVDDLNRAGLQRVQSELQRQVDSFLESKRGTDNEE